MKASQLTKGNVYLYTGGAVNMYVCYQGRSNEATSMRYLFMYDTDCVLRLNEGLISRYLSEIPESDLVYYSELVGTLYSEHPNGFTFDLFKEKHIAKKGYLVAFAETQGASIESAVLFALWNGGIICGRYDTKEMVYHLECSVIVHYKAEAVKLGVVHNQKAIFNLRTNKEIRL